MFTLSENVLQIERPHVLCLFMQSVLTLTWVNFYEFLTAYVTHFNVMKKKKKSKWVKESKVSLEIFTAETDL